MMNKSFLSLLLFLVAFSGCASSDDPQISEYPRMPETYRNRDDGGYRANGNNVANRNPLGMSIYDAAELEAEDDYFGTVVVPLEESKRILNERKLKKLQNEKGEDE